MNNNKKKYRKLPSCAYSCNSKQRLSDIIQKFEDWADVHQVEPHEFAKVWNVYILKDRAKEIYEAHHEQIGNDIEKLYVVLHNAFPGETKLFEYFKQLDRFQYKPGNSIKQHIQEFDELIIKINREYVYFQKYIRTGRMPRSREPQELYTILMNSIRSLTEYYRYVRMREMNNYPKLEEPGTKLTQKKSK